MTASTVALRRGRRTSGRWCGLHFYAAPTVGIYEDAFDEVILSALRCLSATDVARRGEARFFVRYTDPAPHVRIRLRVLDSMRDSDVVDAVCATDEFARSAIRRVTAERYEPEVLRYGGPVGIRLAEQTFAASSRSTVRALKRLCDRPRSARLGMAVSLAFTTIYIAARDLRLASAIARSARDGMLQAPGLQCVSLSEFEDATHSQLALIECSCQGMYNALRRGESITPFGSFQRTWLRAITAYRSAAKRDALRFESGATPQTFGLLYKIVPSLLHMTQNRLGISRIEEAFVSHLVSATCDRLLATETGEQRHA